MSATPTANTYSADGGVNLHPFAPTSASSITIAVTTSSAATQLTTAANQARTVRLYNAGPSTAFIEFGGSGAVATVAASMPIPSGNTEIFVFGGATYIAAITSTGTATLYATPGEGT